MLIGKISISSIFLNNRIIFLGIVSKLTFLLSDRRKHFICLECSLKFPKPDQEGSPLKNVVGILEISTKVPQPPIYYFILRLSPKWAF